MALDALREVEQRGELLVVEARPPSRRSGPRPGTAPPVPRYSTCLSPTVRVQDLAGDLADPVLVGRHLAADDGEPEAPARVDRHRARVAAHRVAGEQHAGDVGVDHQLDGHAHRRRPRRPSARGS